MKSLIEIRNRATSRGDRMRTDQQPQSPDKRIRLPPPSTAVMLTSRWDALDFGGRSCCFLAWIRTNARPGGDGSTNHTHKTLHLLENSESVTDGTADRGPGASKGAVQRESVWLPWERLNALCPEPVTQPSLLPRNSFRNLSYELRVS